MVMVIEIFDDPSLLHLIAVQGSFEVPKGRFLFVVVLDVLLQGLVDCVGIPVVGTGLSSWERDGCH